MVIKTNQEQCDVVTISDRKLPYAIAYVARSSVVIDGQLGGIQL